MKRSAWIFAVLAALFCAAGLVFYLFVTGYEFTGVALFGFGLIFFCFFLLSKLRDKPYARRLRRLFLALLALGVVVLTVSEIPALRASGGTEDVADCRYVIVLGAGLNGETPSFSLSCRLEKAAEYLTAHPGAVAILTGSQGDGETITEAEAMYRALVRAGIAPERLLKEGQARNTRENLAYSLALIREREGGTVPDGIAILSSEYHLYRAGYLAEKNGVSVALIPARTSLFLLRVNGFFREAFAIWKLWLFGG